MKEYYVSIDVGGTALKYWYNRRTRADYKKG